MLEKILIQSRHLTYIAVVLILFCAVALYLFTTVAALLSIYSAVMSDGWDVYSINAIAASFLKIVDFFLLSIGLHLIALGVYKLFINEDIALPRTMASGSFNELKLTLVKLATIVLLLDFVEQALSSRPPRELMEFGIAIAVVLAAVSWGATQLTSKRSQPE